MSRDAGRNTTVRNNRECSQEGRQFSAEKTPRCHSTNHQGERKRDDNAGSTTVAQPVVMTVERQAEQRHPRKPWRKNRQKRRR